MKDQTGSKTDDIAQIGRKLVAGVLDLVSLNDQLLDAAQRGGITTAGDQCGSINLGISMLTTLKGVLKTVASGAAADDASDAQGAVDTVSNALGELNSKSEALGCGS